MQSSRAFKRGSIAFPRDCTHWSGAMLEQQRADYQVELAGGKRLPPVIANQRAGEALPGSSGRGGLHIHISQTAVPVVKDEVDMSARPLTPR